MKKKTGRLLALAGAVFFALGGLAVSRDSRNPGNDTESGYRGGTEVDGNDASELSGSILMAGSTSMEAYVSALAEGYMVIHPDVVVSAEFVGSSAGIEAVLSGTADIGNSSRNLRDAEKKSGAVENVVAIDGIVVCVDRANGVTDLTKQQLIDIYAGAVNNWSLVGGEDQPIVVVGREAGSGSRGAFEEILGIDDRCSYANVLDSAGAVMARVASTPGAIGYVSLDVVDDSVIALQLDGVAPTAENIKAGTYFLSRPFVMATMGEISGQGELVQSWFEYVLGEEGQKIAASVGLVPIE